MNYGWRFVTLYRIQGSRPSPRKRNAKKQNGCLRKPYKSLWKEEKWKAKEKKIYPFECRVMGSQRVWYDWATELNWTECHSKLKRVNYFSCAQSLSHRLFATPWTIAQQAPLSMRLPRQEYWSGLPLPPPDLPDPGIKPKSLVSPALTGGFFTTSAIWKAQIKLRKQQKTVRS